MIRVHVISWILPDVTHYQGPESGSRRLAFLAPGLLRRSCLLCWPEYFCHLGYTDPRTILPAFPSRNSTLLLLALQQLHSPPSEEVERVAVRLLGARLGCCAFVS